jgi:hypothetical protein
MKKKENLETEVAEAEQRIVALKGPEYKKRRKKELAKQMI